MGNPLKKQSSWLALLLLLRLQEASGLLGLAAVVLVLTALGIGTYSSDVARLEALGLVLLTPLLVAAATLYWTRSEGGWLRASSLAVGLLVCAVTFSSVLGAVFPSQPEGRASLHSGATVALVPVVPDATRFTATVSTDQLAGGDGAVLIALHRQGTERRCEARFVYNESRDSAEGGHPARRRCGDMGLPGQGPLTVRLVGLQGSVSRVDVTIQRASLLDRYAAYMLISGAVAAVALQVAASRRRVRSWLLLGVAVQIALALHAPAAIDPLDPVLSSLGSVISALLLGGGAGLGVSYAIARIWEPVRQ